MDVISTFDVDWLGGMSFAVLPVQTADPETVVSELEEVFGNPETGPLANVVRFVPIARLSAILVISARPVYLERAKQWIERLDYGDEQVARIFVYYCENSRASDLGEVLSEIFQPDAAAGRRELAPGLTPTQIGGRAQRQGGRQLPTFGRGGAGGPPAPGSARAAWARERPARERPASGRRGVSARVSARGVSARGWPARGRRRPAASAVRRPASAARRRRGSGSAPAV